MNILNWVVWNRQSLQAFSPEFLLMGASMFLLLVGAFFPKQRNFSLAITLLTLVGYLGLSTLLLNLSGNTILFSGAVAADSFSIFFKFFFGVVALVTTILLNQSNEFLDVSMSEVFAFLLALTMGLSMMASAHDILMMYLTLEMVSVLSYIMVGYKKHSRTSSEAGMKYILYGSFSSGVMIYGLSYIYGLTGSTDFAEISTYIHHMQGISSAPILLFALLCTTIGFAYKIAVFPAQMWCPDVYEGAAMPVTAFLSVGPKAAGFAMTLRFFFTCFSNENGHTLQILSFINWQTALSFLAGATMTLGNLAAISQRNLKRLMAYSSIAHAGYLFMGIATFTEQGADAVLFYLITYLFMNFGVFFILMMVSNAYGTEEIEGYKGLGWRSPWMAGMLTLFLFSLTGIPPFAGFVGKLLLFGAVVKEGMYVLAIVAALNTVVSLFYYARIIRKMYLEKPLDSSPIYFSRGAILFSMLFAVPTLVLFLFWDAIAKITTLSVSSLFG